MSAEAPRPRAARFARIVLERFRQFGLETDHEVAAAGGPSSTTMTKMRAARDRGAELPRPRRDAARRIELAARWAPGSVRRTYDGGDPDPLVIQGDVSFTEIVELLEAMPPADRQHVLDLLRGSQGPDDPPDSQDSETQRRRA